jgi:hypothetical protein
VKRALSSILLVLLFAAPTASADGFREGMVRGELEQAGFADIARTVAKASRPAVTVNLAQRSREPVARGGSRFGGRPDLPAGTAWPRCTGRPQTFLAQIRVRELPGAARELRRLGGTLLFFTHVEFEPGERDYGLWAGDCTTVVHARPGAKLRRTALPSGTLRLHPSRPQFVARPHVPDLALDEDVLMAPLGRVKMTAWERWLDFRYALLGKPGLEHLLLGYSDAPNGGDDCSARAERARDTWRHLFTIGPDDRLGFSVADGGRLQILVAPADLRAGRFDRVCGVFDSG